MDLGKAVMVWVPEDGAKFGKCGRKLNNFSERRKDPG